MIRPLRQRHRVMVVALSAFLPAAFVLGIVSRKPVPVVSTWSIALLHQQPQAYEPLWVRDDLWEKSPLRTRLLTNSTHSTLALEVVARDAIVRPDMLLYWTPGGPKPNDSLPGDAILLGAWMQNPPSPLALPPAAKTTQGKLVLYSLADHEIVNVSKPFVTQ